MAVLQYLKPIALNLRGVVATPLVADVTINSLLTQSVLPHQRKNAPPSPYVEPPLSSWIQSPETRCNLLTSRSETPTKIELA